MSQEKLTLKTIRALLKLIKLYIMELLPQTLGLFFWISLSIIILLYTFSIIKLSQMKSIQTVDKIFWLLAIVFLPIFGAILFLLKKK